MNQIQLLILVITINFKLIIPHLVLEKEKGLFDQESEKARKRRPTTQIPNYLYSLHSRHRESFHAMPRFTKNSITLNGHMKNAERLERLHNMGLVTTIIHHKFISFQNNIGTMKSNENYEKYTRLGQMFQGITFLLSKDFQATLAKSDLIDIQLRFRYHHNETNIQTYPCNQDLVDIEEAWISLSLNNGREFYHEIFFEPDQSHNCDLNSGWITIPMNRILIEELISPKSHRLVEFNVKSPLMKERIHNGIEHEPHLLSFHCDRSLRETLSRKRRSHVQFNKIDIVGNPNRRERFTSGSSHHVHMCQRRDLVVNFKSVGWSNWVLSPIAYNAGFCWGHCPFPLSSHYNTSNHAIILYLVHSMNIAKIQPPCCVAHEMSDESILHYTPNGDLMMQVYENMSVKSCSCR